MAGRFPKSGTTQGSGVAFTRARAQVELQRDAALLERLASDPEPQRRWYSVRDRAVVVGLSQQSRLGELLDRERSARLGWAIVRRSAGGGLVLLDSTMLCLSVFLPRAHPLWEEDLTESYRWLGTACAEGLQSLGIAARRLEIAEARQQVAASSPLARRLCFCSWSPHEVVVGDKKIAGLAQVRRREACLLQMGVLLADQGDLARALLVRNERERDSARALLREKTTGVIACMGRSVSAGQVWQTIDAVVQERLSQFG